jgi:shikimate dehydrogenase
MTDRYAVLGNPVAHSQSPRIHSLFAQQTGQDIEYDRILVEPGGFDAAVADFAGQGGKGVNITVPFKEDAWRLADSRSERAELAGAVNTLVLHGNGRHFGDNTDGAGLVRDLRDNHGAQLRHTRILLLGAGGAARGVIGPLLQQQPRLLVIANRTAGKAVELARHFCSFGHTEGCGLADVSGQQFDLVINATAASITGSVPDIDPTVITPDSWCYDMMYGREPTVFMRWASGLGAATVIDGLGMLVEQAAESFWLWRKVRPATIDVIRTLRDHQSPDADRN